ncbi:MAG: hypothetical protein BWZ11_01794 [Bacteroidetes bacterium ADurb.BinA395]|nr:MAG: hypothetical protein BWZ11_01794 [Bacteroidetes bacterium ADurb.BinA395]
MAFVNYQNDLSLFAGFRQNIAKIQFFSVFHQYIFPIAGRAVFASQFFPVHHHNFVADDSFAPAGKFFFHERHPRRSAENPFQTMFALQMQISLADTYPHKTQISFRQFADKFFNKFRGHQGFSASGRRLEHANLFLLVFCKKRLERGNEFADCFFLIVFKINIHKFARKYLIFFAGLALNSRLANRQNLLCPIPTDQG